MSTIVGTPVQVEFVEATGVIVLEVTIPGPPGPGGPGTGGGATTEEIQDAAAALFTAGGHTGISFAYDDAGNRVTAAVTGLATVATSGAYGDLSGRPTLGDSASRNVGTAPGTVAAGDDARLSDSREWSATTISQAEAEAGTATTRRAFTAERVRQAIVAWWNGATSSFGRSWVALADAAAGTEALNAFTTTLKGLVPAPGTATGKVLSDSGSWVSLSGGGDALVASPLSQFAATTSAQLRGVISDETGTGALVFATSPTLVTPALGTPSSGNLANCTGLPTSGITAYAADTRAQIEAALVAGTNITITPAGSGATRTLTIAATVGSFDPASPGSIGGTTPGAGSFTILSASGALLLPGAAPGSPAAGHLYRITDTIRYRDSGNAERLLLNATDNLANLSNTATARTNLGAAASGAITTSGLTMATNRVLLRGTAGTGAVEEGTLSGGLSINSGALAFTDVIKLRVSNTGETATVGNNYVETTVPRACTVVGATWELAPTATGSNASAAMLYARRSGTKTSLLSTNASLGSGASFTDVTGSLTGTLTLAAGDTLGVDLASVGTGSSGHIFTVLIRYS